MSTDTLLSSTDVGKKAKKRSKTNKDHEDEENTPWRPNFTKAETEALLSAYTSQSNIFNNTLELPEFKRKLQKAWNDVANEVKAVSANDRTVSELQRKLRNMKSDFKKDESKRRKERRVTGGGESEINQTLTREEELLSQIVRPEMIEGIIPESEDQVLEERSNESVETEVVCAVGDLIPSLAPPKHPKKLSKIEQAAEFMKVEHELKMNVYKAQLKAAIFEQQAAVVKKAYWEQKISKEFYDGREMRIDYEAAGVDDIKCD